MRLLLLLPRAASDAEPALLDVLRAMLPDASVSGAGEVFLTRGDLIRSMYPELPEFDAWVRFAAEGAVLGDYIFTHFVIRETDALANMVGTVNLRILDKATRRGGKMGELYYDENNEPRVLWRV